MCSFFAPFFNWSHLGKYLYDLILALFFHRNAVPSFSKDELNAILKFGAEDLFKEDTERDSKLQVECLSRTYCVTV